MYFYIFCTVLFLNFNNFYCENEDGFMGTAELLQSGRRSRLSRDFAKNNQRSDKSVKLTEETMREYGNLLQLDTKNFSEQQKILLERIVERVARLGGAAEFTEISNTTDNNPNESQGRGSKSRLKKNSHKNMATVVPIKHEAIAKDKSINPDIQKITNKIQLSLQQKANVTEVDFGNITTSSIVDSLSSDNAREDIYKQRRPLPSSAAPSVIPSTIVDKNKTKKEPVGPAKPTKYHYYPHNQHIYLLPECAIQQVCNAVYVRLNYTQPLCACPSRYRDPCSASINEDDLHTTKLVGDGNKKAITLAKTCESTTEMRECRSPRDWSLLALQNTRTGKSHYLVICRCPDNFNLEGPMAHDQPTYASVPGIRVFGMMCVKPGGSAVRKPVNQAPKRDSIAYRPPGTSTYQQQPQQSYHQNQYQANYQYLHRADPNTNNRPIATTIKNAHYEKVTLNNNQQYDDVYGRQKNIEENSDTTLPETSARAEEAESAVQEDQKVQNRNKRNVEDDEDEEYQQYIADKLKELLWQINTE